VALLCVSLALAYRLGAYFWLRSHGVTDVSITPIPGDSLPS
jgi:hypothetical protein